ARARAGRHGRGHGAQRASCLRRARGERAAERLAETTGIPFRAAADKFAALSAHDAVVTFSGTLRTLAAALMK
ncbi:lyase family protein, partial [Salmonella enterica subsp. enterica serovar Minnesota]